MSTKNQIPHSLALSALRSKNDTTPKPITIATSNPRQTQATGFMAVIPPLRTHLETPAERAHALVLVATSKDAYTALVSDSQLGQSACMLRSV